MTIRPYEAKDAPTVATLHRLSLPRGFLSTLGDRFLGILYGLLARSPRTCVWIAADDQDRCVGFVAGSLDIRASYRHVLSRGIVPLTLAVIPSLVRPGVLKRIVQTMAYTRRPHDGSDGALTSSIAPETIRAELLSIAISAEARGYGLGRRLVAALEENFRRWDHEGPYRVVTDTEDLRSNAFYVSLGFAKAGEFKHHEHVMSLYTKILADTDLTSTGIKP